MERIKGYLKKAWNHKWKLITIPIIFYGSYKFISYQKYKEELYLNEKRRKILKDTDKASNEMIKSQLSKISSEIDEISSITKIISELRNPNITQEDKMKLWNKLKISTFTATMTTVYAITILVIYTKITLNIIGKYIYHRDILKEKIRKPFNFLSFSNLENDRPIDNASFCDIPASINKRFISSIDYFIKNGLKDLYDIVEQHASNVLSGWNLAEECSSSDFNSIIFTIRSNIEIVNSVNFLLSKFVLPIEENKLFIDVNESVYNNISDDDKYILLENELRDIVESEYMNQFFLELLKVSFESLSPILSIFESDSEPIKIPMAKLIPQINKFRKTLFQTEKNELLESVSFIKYVERFFYNHFQSQM